MYQVPNVRYLLKSIPIRNNWIKVYWLRGGSAPHATFAGEQVIDELAHAAKMDPVAFRVQNLTQGDMIHSRKCWIPPRGRAEAHSWMSSTR